MPPTLDAMKREREIIRTKLSNAQQSGDKANVKKYKEELKQINEAIAEREKQ